MLERVPVGTPGGEVFWYSPLHRRAAWDVPPSTWGGSLAEEMVSRSPRSLLRHCFGVRMPTFLSQELKL